jgi:hypothetical protein
MASTQLSFFGAHASVISNISPFVGWVLIGRTALLNASLVPSLSGQEQFFYMP